MASRHSGQSRKARFIERFRETGNVWRSCLEAGIPRSTVYKWQEHDERFALQMRQAEIEAVERLEEEARRRAFDGVAREKGIYYKGQLVGKEIITEYSDTLLVLLLKARKPEVYKERLDVSTTTIVKSYAGLDVDRV